MIRRVFSLVLGALLLAFSHPAEAQQPVGKVPRIGFLDSGAASDPRNIFGVDAFRQGLREVGYVEVKTSTSTTGMTKGNLGDYKSWPRS